MVSLRKLFGMQERVRVLTATDGRDILLNSPAGWEIQQPWLWWDGPAGGDGTGGPWGNPPPGAGSPGQWLVSVPGVSFCTSLISSAIAGLPWRVYRGAWEQLDTPAWIDDPQGLRPDGRKHAGAPGVNAVKLSAVEFWTEWITSALWWGDGYAWSPLLGADGSPRPPMWILNPNLVSIDGDPGNRHYYVEDANGDPHEIPPEQLMHLRGEPSYGKGHGHGVLTRHLADLGLAAQVRTYAAGQYRSGIPAGYLKSSQPHMDSTQAGALRDKWLATHGASAARSIAVLNATTEFVPLAVTPLDAQLDMARTWSLRDIAMAFHVPAYKLGVPGDTSTYANVESRNIDYRQDSLMPWIRRIESCLDAEFPLGTELRVNTDALLKADTATRFAAYSVGLDKGIFTRDEVRAREGLPPLGTAADPNLPNTPPAPPDLTKGTP
jgi:HK97 family phage portal protein